MTIKIQFETEKCTRCNGTGQFSYNPRDGRTCFKCNGRKVQLTRRGMAARKTYDVVMDEMNRTWADVKVGDRAYANDAAFRLRWLTIAAIEPSTPTRSRVGGEDAEWVTHERAHVRYENCAVDYIPRLDSKVRVWDAAIHRRAAVRVSRMAGATVTGLED